MAHFAKPAEGSWTEHYPELGTGPVSYEDSISPEHYERERKAIFGRTWLNVGRVEQLPRNGSYFTKELDAAGTSLVVVRGADGDIHAFHNICRHRGNKLVWQDYPGEETSGTCRQFTCKYHGWRYSTDGQLTFIQQESEFFDLDPSDYGLADVQVEAWEGFIFVNLDKDNSTSLKDYLGGLGAGLAGYPFDKMTQVYKYRADVGSNWKLFIDAFAEFYHAPILHAKQATADESRKLSGYGFEALAYRLDGPHGMVSSWGGMAPPKDPAMVKPIERAVQSGLFGPWERPDIDGLDELPPALNPAGHRAWGVDSFVFFPNFMLLIWQPGWYLTVPLLAHLLQHPHLRGHALLRATQERPRAPAPRACRRDFQGVRTPGRQHPRGHPDDARVASCVPLSFERPGDPSQTVAQDGRGLRGRLRTDTGHAGAHLQRVLGADMTTRTAMLVGNTVTRDTEECR